MRIAFTTLGCKINQYETDRMRQDLEAWGGTIVPFSGEADVYVINTCSVTARTDYQCRQAIRSAVRKGKGAKVVVTGCYAETRPDEIRKIAGVDLVLGNQEKGEIVNRLLLDTVREDQPGPTSMAADISPVHGRTRGFLKIQDGCDSRCTYCIVPLARGPSRSIPLEKVTEQFDALLQAGCPEIVLSGIHIGRYGEDLSDGPDLAGLLRNLLSRRGGSRIRVSSIEPNEISQGLIELIGDGLCRHLHIPLQSGDDGILAAMNREYISLTYRNLLDSLAGRIPSIALGADVMVGFPGEGDVQFQNTLHLIERSPLTHLHVFSYSPRPGTPAASMSGQVPEQVKKERSKLLRDLGQKKNQAFRRSFAGQELVVVVEDKVDALSGLLTGLSDNYIRMTLKGANGADIGEKRTVKVTEVDEKRTFSVIL
ncbi:MAG: tRNA (N(6)-L-threonylcarbamoyladenosine(37)-C(2))-methylthiotransferase MtaB [Nitrospirae bacterium GWC2_57_13]|jgi:threonylcarbamoyladenosine tRNA methylthiotransferase MtaB|nr:MAG: tRNA (N(6)-L-threonylcarbamoyladenosine(37)-C(2))-methylthiotransferase MtaB [Nitrospirae bacterium GWC2_57_13]